MATICVFCDRSELQSWISELCSEQGLRILFYGNAKTGKVSSHIDFDLTEDIYQVFLFPKEAAIPSSLLLNAVDQRRWGWLSIQPGGEIAKDGKSLLLLTQIHGDEKRQGRFDPVKTVRSLRRRISLIGFSGVLGTNLNTNGRSAYKRILYTKITRQLFENGVIWKQEPNDSIVFEPIPNNATLKSASSLLQ